MRAVGVSCAKGRVTRAIKWRRRSLDVDLFALLSKHSLDILTLQVATPDNNALQALKRINQELQVPAALLPAEAGRDIVEASVNAGRVASLW